MLNAEHVVHEYSPKDIEADVGPADTKVSPALTINYMNESVKVHT